MKKIKKFISVFLSLILIVSIFLNFTLNVYASDVSSIGSGSSRPDNSDSSEDTSFMNKETIENMNVIERGLLGVTYIASSIAAVYHGDFEQYLINDAAFNEFIEKKDAVKFDSLKGITISKDFSAYIKDKLKLYSEETNGYYIVPTFSINQIEPSGFKYKDVYTSICNVVKENGMVGVLSCCPNNVANSHSYTYFVNFKDFVKQGNDFVLNGTYASGFKPDDLSNSSVTCNVYNANWLVQYFGYYIYDYDPSSSGVVSSINDLEYNRNEKDYYYSNRYNPFYFTLYNYWKSSFSELKSMSGTLGNYQFSVITVNGDRMRFFKGETALKNYSVGHRTVYFGKDFYEKEPQEITVSFDDLEKYLKMDYTDYFDRISQQIAEQGGNLSEAEVEKITDSILDSLKDISGNIDDVNNSVNNLGPKLDEQLNILQKILAKLTELDAKVEKILDNALNGMTGVEQRLDSILLQLGVISEQLDGMTTEEIEAKTDDALDEMQLTFEDLGDLAKTKFPLSLPWDIYHLMQAMGGGNRDYPDKNEPNVPEAVALLIEEEPDTFIHTASLYGEDGEAVFNSLSEDDGDVTGNGIVLYSDTDSGSVSDNGGGGSHTSSGGYLHGGGGSSRWGAWLSETGAPIFYIPVEFSKSMGIGGLLIIDLSGFEVLHDISRTLFVIIFSMSLVHLTFKAVTAGKEILTFT